MSLGKFCVSNSELTENNKFYHIDTKLPILNQEIILGMYKRVKKVVLREVTTIFFYQTEESRL